MVEGEPTGGTEGEDEVSSEGTQQQAPEIESTPPADNMPTEGGGASGGMGGGESAGPSAQDKAGIDQARKKIAATPSPAKTSGNGGGGEGTLSAIGKVMDAAKDEVDMFKTVT
jgi:hypothetical protein